MQTTIREVARAAGVSPGTVSRALHGHSTLSAACIARVHEAAKSLGYTPLRIHKKRGNSSGSMLGKSVPLVLLGMDQSLASLPSVVDTVHGVEAALSNAGTSTIIVNAPDPNPIPKVLESLQPAGLILKGAMQGSLFSSSKSPFRKWLQNFPIVWITGRPQDCWGDSSSANDFAAGAMAAQHLIEEGHRQLAIVNPKPDHLLFRRREDGFISQARRLKSQVCLLSRLTVEWKFPLKAVDGVSLVQRLTDAVLINKPRPTAIFTPADSIAVLVYRSLAIRGVEVGREISLISCNNEVPLTAGLYPALTTVDIRARAVGSRAVDLLKWRIKAGVTEPSIELMTEPVLLLRDSVTRVSERR